MILLLLYFITTISAETVDIHSPRITNYGEWNDWSMCPDGMYAYGAQVKVEGDQRGKDDTGLNAVSLYCAHLNWNEYKKENWIMSGEGPWGDWKGIKYCPERNVLIGFSLRSEADQRGKDDVAADNFKAYCGTPDGPRNTNLQFEGDTPGWGEYTRDQFCPIGFAVCGIQSQIEGDQRGGDDTALNNIDLRCCRVQYSSGSCTPDYELVGVNEYDNSLGSGTITATYQKKISFTRTSGSTETIGHQEKQGVLQKVTTGVEFSASGIYKGINLSGTGRVNYENQWNKETISSREVQNMVQDAMTHERTVSETFTVPAYKKVIIEQLFMTCGGIRVGLSKTISRSQ